MTEIPRNGFDQPLIIPLGADGKPDLGAKLVPYRRASKYGKVTDDTTNLSRWNRNICALGLVRRPELLERVRGIEATYAFPLDNAAAKKQMHEVMDEAFDVGGGNVDSERGTWWHTLSEYVDRGEPLPIEATGVEHVRIRQYSQALKDHGIEILGIELFIVNDYYRSAGTFDRLLRLADGSVVVGDLKTGSHDPLYPHGVASQLDIYAGGQLYDPATGERTPIHPELDTSKGILIHLPAKDDGCRLYEIDLSLASENTLTAERVYKARSINKKMLCKPL